MAPKNQKGSSSNKQKPQEEEREDSLQAVVGSLPPGLERKTHINAHRFLQILTKRDSDLILSKSRGYVLTLDRSNGMLKNFQCLLPLANTPLIDYTLEFLASAGVEQVFIYCGAHTDQLEEYIKYSFCTDIHSTARTLTVI